jgi:hypothetical protein
LLPHAPALAPEHCSDVPHPLVAAAVHVFAVQVPGDNVHVPEPQSPFTAQTHLPLTHRPPPHCESRVQVFARQLPWTEPVQVWVLPQVLFEQETPVLQSPEALQEPLPHEAFAVHWQRPATHWAFVPQSAVVTQALGVQKPPAPQTSEFLQSVGNVQALYVHEL